MTFDKRFALITPKNEVLFPYEKLERKSGKYGFALSPPGKRDRNGEGVYTTDIEEVIRHVVLDGWKVRASTTSKAQHGSYALGKRATVGYWVAPEFLHLVSTATVAPVTQLPDHGEPLSTVSDPAPSSLASEKLLATDDVDEDKHQEADHLESEIEEHLPPSDLVRAAETEIDADPQNKDLNPTERLALVNARLGQGSYRKGLLRIWDGRCAVTGCAIDCVLIASHALAWAKSSNAERLDPYNGLLLAASVDRLFDQGIISFADDGGLLVQPTFDIGALLSIGLNHKSKLRRIDNRHRPYLRAHRIAHGFEHHVVTSV